MVRRESKKTIHNIPCLRFKVTSMAVYRSGGLGLTKRFSHTQVVDIPGHNHIYSIEVEHQFCRRSLRLQVRRFTPEATDKTDWTYMDGKQPKTQPIDAFCLADVEKAARDFNTHINDNYIDGLEQAVEESDDIVKDIFAAIASHCRSETVGRPFYIGVCSC
jgi:hypothetical protein